jgi:radical SAM superfamily enzyme YgiQ (UPF0313 family)
MNVLLLYPEFPTTFWSFKHALKFVRKRASLPPLGLLTVAAMLPREWRVRLVDLNVGKLGKRDLAWADLVFVSAMIAQRGSAQELIARCRAAGKTIVAGGPLFTSSHAEFPGVDHFVLNEAELTLPGFLRDLAAGTAQRTYSTGEFADVRESPVPRWDLLRMRRYGSMALQYSRGCPFDCEFCDVTAKFGRLPRTKTAAQVIAECDKRQNQGRDLVADVKRIQRAGLQVQGGFIVGFDSDGPGTFQRQVDFIQRSGIVTAMVGLLNALPDTRLHARLKREGRLLGRSSGDNVDGTTNFTPRMSLEQLLEGYHSILRGIYAPRPYYQRIRTFLREYRRPRVAAPLSWRHGFALAWSGVRLGVVGRERLQYWRLLLWTMFHRPALLQLAVTFAIYGHHFRKCCDAMGA